MAYVASFNGYGLQDSSFRSRIIQHTNTPSRSIQAESRARADGLTVVNAKYSSRVIEVEGQLSAATRQALVAKIDEMKTNLGEVSGDLLIDYGDSQRLYFATVQSIELPEDFFNINAVPYKITFLCADPFGYATSSGVVSFAGQTAMLRDVLLSVSGSVNTDPVLHLTVNSATAFAVMFFSNENTNESIVISKPGGNFTSSDQIVINCKTKQVYLNASGIDYTGRFPSIAPPTTQLRVQIQATAVNYDLTYRYLPAYI